MALLCSPGLHRANSPLLTSLLCHRVSQRHSSASSPLRLHTRPCCVAEAASNNKGCSLFPGEIPPPLGRRNPAIQIDLTLKHWFARALILKMKTRTPTRGSVMNVNGREASRHPRSGQGRCHGKVVPHHPCFLWIFFPLILRLHLHSQPATSPFSLVFSFSSILENEAS